MRWSRGGMGSPQPPADPARPGRVPIAQGAVRRLRAERLLPVGVCLIRPPITLPSHRSGTLLPMLKRNVVILIIAAVVLGAGAFAWAQGAPDRPSIARRAPRGSLLRACSRRGPRRWSRGPRRPGRPAQGGVREHHLRPRRRRPPRLHVDHPQASGRRGGHEGHRRRHPVPGYRLGRGHRRRPPSSCRLQGGHRRARGSALGRRAGAALSWGFRELPSEDYG